MGKTLLILMGGDFLLAFLAHYFGFFVRFGKVSDWVLDFQEDIFRVLVFAIVLIMTTYFSELYSREQLFGRKEAIVRILASLTLSFFILSGIYYLFPDIMIGRGMLILSLLAFGIIQFLWHNRYPFLLRIPGIAQNILIFGVGPLAQTMTEVMGLSKNNYVFSGYIRPNGDTLTVPSEKIVGIADELVEAAKSTKADKIIISLSERRGVLPVRDILRCKLNGVEIIDAMNFYESVTGKLMIENINPSWFIFSDGFRVTSFMRFYKRIFDLFFSSVGLILSLPFYPLIALVIRIDSKGPIFFTQERVGVNELPFKVIKFRTMVQDAEKNTGAVWAQKNDPRITRLGRIMRKTRIDELPQLINVFRGDMSFVGPRPERPLFVEKLKEDIPYYAKRHSVKPGLTGWAQVKFPYGASIEDSLEKLRYDLYYIKNYSLLMDFVIILETVKVVLFGRGGR